MIQMLCCGYGILANLLALLSQWLCGSNAKTQNFADLVAIHEISTTRSISLSKIQMKCFCTPL